jgi:hypothetical protein
MPPVAARRPNHDHHSSAQRSHRDDPGLAIIAAFVRNIQGLAREHLGGISEIETAVAQRARRFAGSNVIFI